MTESNGARTGRVIRQAVRHGQKARIALSGPTGSGKTWTALVVAKALAPTGRVLVVDTERGSASLYADQFAFEVLEWDPPFDPRELKQVLLESGGGYDVVVVDSLSHYWTGEGGTLDIVDAAAQRSGGDSFAGWKTGTPAQQDLVAGMLNADCHVIATMRSKMEYVLEADAKGRQVPRRVGMAPIQRDGLEYEFTVVGEINLDHQVNITKTRCQPLTDRLFKAGHADELGLILAEWLAGAQPDPGQDPAWRKAYESVIARLVAMGEEERKALIASLGFEELRPRQLRAMTTEALLALESKVPAAVAAGEAPAPGNSPELNTGPEGVRGEENSHA